MVGPCGRREPTLSSLSFPPVRLPHQLFDRFRRAALWALVCLCGLQLAAHPVAQGAIEIFLRPGQAQLTVHVSEEELLVSFAHAPDTETDALAHHGRYLLRHLQIVQGTEVRLGQLRSATRIAGAALAAVYELEFKVADDRPLTVRQDVLREFDFAPGNPWEASYMVRLTQAGTPVAGSRLLTAREPLTVESPSSSGESSPGPSVFASFFRHGWHHIMGGYDHLLFMCALVLASRSLLGLVKVVTAFTIAHTVTLVLAVQGWVHVPTYVVEPMIAASIVFAALMTVFRSRPARDTSQLWLAFGFGLFHGLGFAGGLLDALQGQPGTAALTALCGFAFGVEAGHQFVALPLFGLLLAARHWCDVTVLRQRFYQPILRGVSGLVSAAGMVYLAAALRAPHL